MGDTILIMDRTKVIIKDTIIKVKISTKDTIIIKDMTKAAIRVKILAMDWRKAQKNQLMAIMIKNSAPNILKMVILISHRVTILIDQVATILRDQQVMVQSQKMR